MGAKCCYTVDTMRETLRCLTPLFDVVRLVDPTDTAVVTLEEDGSLRREPYTCFHVWNRECRCFNCTSMQAAAGSCQRTKYEFIRENVFYVVSQPLTLFAGGEQLEVVMEIVSHVSNQLLLEPQEDGKNMLERLEEIQEKLYRDDLTGPSTVDTSMSSPSSTGEETGCLPASASFCWTCGNSRLSMTPWVIWQGTKCSPR